MMAQSKIDLPEDLLSLNATDEKLYAKGGVAGGHSEQKLVMGFSDETKDQLTSENSIPLSPQWLYAKPSDAKIGSSVASEHTEQYGKEEKRFEEEEITQFQKFD